nr:flagellar biosynthesis regulator FlaF [Roseovarius autotrophicus]
MAQAAFRSQVQTVRTPRALEYDALARVTRGLRNAPVDRPDAIGRLAAAVHANQELWILFAVDVADPHNPLPLTLRAQILELARFTRVHSRRILLEGASVEPLVDINMALMRGLAGPGREQ